MVFAPADPIGLWLSRWRGMYGWRRAPLGRGSSMEAGAAGEVLLQGAPGLEQRPEGTGARWHLLPLGQHLHRAAPGQGGPSLESGGVFPQVVLEAPNRGSELWVVRDLISKGLMLWTIVFFAHRGQINATLILLDKLQDRFSSTPQGYL